MSTYSKAELQPPASSENLLYYQLKSKKSTLIPHLTPCPARECSTLSWRVLQLKIYFQTFFFYSQPYHQNRSL